MGEEKVTVMVLKVDLQCSDCYRKVKRLLCKYPQIRDQVFDEKQNTVTITVVCCTPERIRDKLCSKGRKSIKSIEIKPVPEPVKPKPNPVPATDPEKSKAPKAEPVTAPAPAAEAEKPKQPEKLQKDGSKNGSKNGSKPAPATDPKPAEAKPTEAPKPKASEPPAQWVPGFQPPQQAQAQMSMYPPVAVCCYDGGYQAGPGYGYGYGPPINYGYAYGRPSYPPGYYPNAGRPDCNYFSEENPSACSIM